MFFAEGFLATFGLVLVRTSALIAVAPIFGMGTGFSGYKLALIVGLTVVLPSVAGPLAVEMRPGMLGVLALRELMIGVFLGFFAQLLQLAVKVAGELIGHEMGFMVARQVDPATGLQVPLITSFYETLFLLALLTMNGHILLVRCLGESFQRAPVGRLDLGANFGEALLTAFGEMFQAGLIFAAPVMVFLMLVSILIGLLSRVVPHLNVMEVGFTLRVLISTGAMFLFAPLLEPAMTRLHDALFSWLNRGLDILAAN